MSFEQVCAMAWICLGEKWRFDNLFSKQGQVLVRKHAQLLWLQIALEVLRKKVGRKWLVVLQLLERIEMIVKIHVGLVLGQKWHLQVVIITHTVTLLEKNEVIIYLIIPQIKRFWFGEIFWGCVIIACCWCSISQWNWMELRAVLDWMIYFAFLSNEIEHQQEAIITHPQKLFSKPKSFDLWNDEVHDNFIFFK